MPLSRRPSASAFAATLAFAFCAALALPSCTPDGYSELVFVDRKPGERTPLTQICGYGEEPRCLLPWPNTQFLARDLDTSTGVRLAVVQDGLLHDDLSVLMGADGFSRVTPIVTSLPASNVDPAQLTGAGLEQLVVLLDAQPDSPGYGQPIPLRVSVVEGTMNGQAERFVWATPRRPLAAASDYVAVLTRLRTAQGALFPQGLETLEALGHGSGMDANSLAAYHAPTRALLKLAGIADGSIQRVWDFTTRSKLNPVKRLAQLRKAAQDAVAAGRTTAHVKQVELPASGPIAAVVLGTLSGLPNFLTSEGHDGSLALDPQGFEPVANGTRSAPFRVVLPRAGTGTYPVVLYGHGTGGNVRDDSFDAELAGEGLAKLGVEFYGWTDTTLPATFGDLSRLVSGSERAVAHLEQALANLAGLQAALAGPLGDLLSAPTLDGQPNPAQGRAPRDRRAALGRRLLGGDDGARARLQRAGHPGGRPQRPGRGVVPPRQAVDRLRLPRAALPEVAGRRLEPRPRPRGRPDELGSGGRRRAGRHPRRWSSALPLAGEPGRPGAPQPRHRGRLGRAGGGAGGRGAGGDPGALAGGRGGRAPGAHAVPRARHLGHQPPLVRVQRHAGREGGAAADRRLRPLGAGGRPEGHGAGAVHRQRARRELRLHTTLSILR